MRKEVNCTFVHSVQGAPICTQVQAHFLMSKLKARSRSALTLLSCKIQSMIVVHWKCVTVPCGATGTASGKCVQVHLRARTCLLAVKPFCVFEACFEGVQMAAIEIVMSEIDIFVSSTGNSNFFTLEQMKKLDNNAVVGKSVNLQRDRFGWPRGPWK